MDDLEKLNTAKSIREFFEKKLHNVVDPPSIDKAVYEAVLDLCLDIIDPPGKPYMFRFSSDDVVIECATSLKDAVMQLADKYRLNTNLFKIAISACDETNCVDMFNQFVTSGSCIVGRVYRIDKLMYTNMDLFHDSDDDAVYF